MLVTREADYAVTCVLEVARHKHISAAEIARRHEISPSFVANIVHSLAKSGIAVTTRGAGGGVSLARAADSLTLLDVIEAVQGRLTVNSCVANPRQCDRTDGCSAYFVFRGVQNQMRLGLDVTFAELLEGSDDSGPPTSHLFTAIARPDPDGSSGTERHAAKSPGIED